MPENVQGWFFLSQLIMQRIASTLVVTLATLSLGWWGAAMLGWAPWVQLDLDLGGSPLSMRARRFSPS